MNVSVSPFPKRIFYFWEPEDSMPDYLKLCIQTWRKFLPDYEIIGLNYRNIYDYVDREEIPEWSLKFFSKAIQSDFLRMAVLRRHGGIYFDCDIIVNGPLTNLETVMTESEAFIFGTDSFIGGAGILGSVTGGTFVSRCLEQALDKIAAAEPYMKKEAFYERYRWVFYPLLCHYRRKIKRKLIPWSYMISIFDDLARSESPKTLRCFDFKDICPERIVFQDDQSGPKMFRRYWLDPSNRSLNDIPDLPFNLIALHNSWTPQSFRQQSEEAFIRNGTLLSAYLQKLLNS